jgi:hypothetical protein
MHNLRFFSEFTDGLRIGLIVDHRNDCSGHAIVPTMISGLTVYELTM